MDKEKKSILSLINSSLIKKIFISLGGGGILISIFAYFGKNYFELSYKRNDQIYQYKDDIYKKLYEKSQPEIVALRESIGKLLSLLQNNYGISTFEMKPIILNFERAIKSYDTYVAELEFYGNSAQLASAKEIQNWSYNVYSKFSSQFMLSEQVQNSIRDMIIGTYENPAHQNPETYIKFHLDKIQNELDKMIQEENKLYYELRNLDLHIFKLLSNQLIYKFRLSIGLEMTEEISKSYEIASQIEQLQNNAEYKDSKLPYLVAESRAVLSNNFSADKDIELENKNSLLKGKILIKIMNQVVENDSYLKKKKEENIRSPNK